MSAEKPPNLPPRPSTYRRSQQQPAASNIAEDDDGYLTPADCRRPPSTNTYHSLKFKREEPAKLLVRHLPENCSEDNLQNYFESKRKFGTELEVNDVEIFEDEGVAIVTFGDASAVKHVLEKHASKPCRLSNVDLEILPLMEEEEQLQQMTSPEEPVKILVKNLPENCSKDNLQNYFESKRKFGTELEVTDVKMFEDDDAAIVTFDDPSAVKHVLEKHASQPCRLSDVDLEILPFMDEEDQQQTSSSHHYSDIYESSGSVSRVIEVRGYKHNTTEQTLELYFENTRKSGGDETESVQMFDDDGYAIVTFKQTDVAANVLQQNKHVLEGKTMSVKLHRPSTPKKKHDIDERTSSGDTIKTIEVRGFNYDTTDDTLTFYFENRRRSGGDETEHVDVNRDDGVALITFKHEGVVESVLKKTHDLEGATLSVRAYVTSKNDILFSGLPSIVSEDSLVNFVEAKLKVESVAVSYNNDRTKAIIKCREEVDFENAIAACKKFRIGDVCIEPSRVPVTNCIIVTNIGDGATEDTFRYYFENKNRSAGGDIERVELDISGGYCLVYFKETKVVADVCAKKEHKVARLTVDVRPYHSCLSVTKGVDCTCPEPILLTKQDPYKLKFLKNIESQRNQLEVDLEECNAKISWSSKPIQIEVNDDTKISKDWTTNARKAVDNYIDVLEVKERPVEHSWSEIMSALGSLNMSHPDGIGVFPEKDNSIIVIVAHKALIKSAWQQIEDEINKVERDIEERKKEVTETKTIESWKIKYLYAVKYADMMQREFRKVRINMDVESCKIKFTGPRSDEEGALLRMFEILQDVKEHNVVIGKENVRLLQCKSTKVQVSENLKHANLGDVWEIDTDKLHLYSDDDSDLRKMETIVMKMLAKQSMALNPNLKTLLQSKKWKDIETKLNTQFKDCILIVKSDKSLDIYTLADHLDAILDELEEFMDKNTICKERMTIDSFEIRFIKNYLREDMDKGIEGLKRSGGVQNVTFGNADEVVIEGTSDGVKAAKKVLQDLKRSIKHEQHVKKKPGIMTYMSTQQGKECIQKIEMNAKCVVEVMGSGLGRSIGRGQTNLKVFDKLTYYAEATIKGTKLVVVGGDITSLNVDVIVNAANKDMQHVGGLAAVIVRKGGKTIQDECNDRVQNKGKMRVGEVFMSGAGNIQHAKAVAHAVGPTWEGGKKNEKKLLQGAIKICLEKCEKRKHGSIAFPAISAGVYHYPVDKACGAIVEVIDQHAKGNSSIKTVYLSDISVTTVKAFKDALENIVGNINILNEIDKSDAKSKQTWLQDSENESVDGTSPSANPFGNTDVSLVKGQISKEKVDVIVNSTSSDLQLEKGALSKALSRAGGREIQQACNDDYQNGISIGEVAVTTGGKLKCKKVFHIALKQYHGHRELQGVKDSVKACLEEAHKKNYSTISFPTMGTGGQRYPKDKVAAALFSSIADFCLKHTKTSLKKVRIVVFEEDDQTYEAFITEEKQWAHQKQSYGGKSPRGRDSNSGFGNAKVINLSKNSGEFEVGHMSVKVVQEDITEQSTDAIVASCNLDLKLDKGAVTKAIMKKGGPEIEKDCKSQVSTMKKEGIAIGTAGRLKSKYIIYVDTKYKTHEWRPVVLASLKKAEKHNIQSLSFPAFGTSVGCAPEDIANVVFQAIVDFLKDSPKHLKEIRVVIYQQDMVSNFIKGMKSSIEGTGSAPHSRDSRESRHGRQSRNSGQREYDQSSKQDDSKNTCTIKIYSNNETSIKTAKRQFDKTVNDEWFVQDFKPEESHLNNLNKQQIDGIKNSARNNHVFVDIDKDKGVIHIQGLLINVSPVKDDIHRIIRGHEKSVHERQHAKMLKNIVTWFYLKDQKQFPFPDKENLIIETAFQNKDPKAQIEDRSGGKYEIDFASMEEYDKKNPSAKCPVIRRDVNQDAGFENPKTWSKMGKTENLKLEQIQNNSPEYNSVVTEFQKTLGRTPNIVKIERIQNKTLYTQYAAKRKQINENNPKQKQNQRVLWHGTAVDAVPSINAHGFNRSYCGKNAVAIGNGVYFAVNASYSDGGTYSPPDGHGNKRMYRTLVLTGDYTNGQGGMRVPPAKNSSQAHILYDSVTNSTSNPVMFVIFHDTQAYPEHLITYK